MRFLKLYDRMFTIHNCCVDSSFTCVYCFNCAQHPPTQAGREDVVECLLNVGTPSASVNDVGQDGVPPLLVAAEMESVGVMKLLLQAGADATHRRYSVQERLGSAGVNIKSPLAKFPLPERDMTVLELAILRNFSAEVLRTLVENTTRNSTNKISATISNKISVDDETDGSKSTAESEKSGARVVLSPVRKPRTKKLFACFTPTRDQEDVVNDEAVERILDPGTLPVVDTTEEPDSDVLGKSSTFPTVLLAATVSLEIKPGQIFTLHSLGSDRGKLLNGLRVSSVKFNGGTGRWAVHILDFEAEWRLNKCHNFGFPVWIKPENLRPRGVEDDRDDSKNAIDDILARVEVLLKHGERPFCPSCTCVNQQCSGSSGPGCIGTGTCWLVRIGPVSDRYQISVMPDAQSMPQCLLPHTRQSMSSCQMHSQHVGCTEVSCRMHSVLSDEQP